MKIIHILSSVLLVFITLTITSCDKNDTDNTPAPTNLVIEVTYPGPEKGNIHIVSTADNATLYKLYIGNATVTEASNEIGIFDYVFTEAGDYKIRIKAYNGTEKYIEAEKQITIEENDPVSIDQGYTTPMQYNGYQLTWNDEFDGNTLNTNYWSYETGGGGWGNNELQYYRPDNTSVGGGTLTIEARKENYENRNYTSSRLVTLNKKSFTYGRVDIRALLPEGQGIWPALWMLGSNIETVSWPACGETDIMEMIGGSGRENQIHGTLHWEYNGGHAEYGQSFVLPSGTFADEYHVFSIIWDENTIKWYMNDQQFNVVDITPSHMSEFHDPSFFIFNVAVGGLWPGNPDASTVFPQQMKVDYIRVFQKTAQ
ncbi:MAG: glycoside hydrolase family 16 protein [Lentimicrobium sp.]|jgi:hypothetical protein|nr:glycoside hydrolase family 16 protein [Lentimicrobium sp.]